MFCKKDVLKFLKIHRKILVPVFPFNTDAGLRRQNLAETDRWSYCNQEEWLEEFLNDKGSFYNDSESDNSDNDHENYNENNEQ